ncbi:MAG: hypothetical protein AAGD43_02240 [Pseudomonadota bacterium]
MSWRALAILIFSVALGIQSAFAIGFYIGKIRHRAPTLVTFDPEASLLMFVLWAEDRYEGEAFDNIIPEFETRLETEMQAFALETGTVIVRGTVLTGSDEPVADVTTPIMNRVLTDAAF